MTSKIATFCLPKKNPCLLLQSFLPSLGQPGPAVATGVAAVLHGLGRLQGSWKAAFSLVIHRGRPHQLSLPRPRPNDRPHATAPPTTYFPRSTTPSTFIFRPSATPPNYPTALAVLFKTRLHS